MCCVCDRQIDDHRQRRKLHSDASRHVIPALVRALSSHCTRIGHTVSEEVILQLLRHKSSYICKNCFSSCEKLVKLQRETKKLEELILSKLSQCGTYSTFMQDLAATPSPVGSSEPTDTPSAPAAKRPCISSFTPTRVSKGISRQVLFAKQQPGITPGVTVSYNPHQVDSVYYIYVF